MAYSIIAARLRAARRAARPTSAVTLSQTTTGDFAHQGHRLDLADERLISHREPRWIDGRRYVWRDGMWCLTPDLHRTVEAPRVSPPTEIRLTRKSAPHATNILKQAVRRVVDAGGRPEDVTVIVGRRLK